MGQAQERSPQSPPTTGVATAAWGLFRLRQAGLDERPSALIVAFAMIAKATESTSASSSPIGPHGLGLLIARCRKRLWTAAHQELVRHGDAVWTWQVLTHLEMSGALTQNEVANSTGQHPGAISRLLVELESQGLVRRRRDPKDQRRILVELTRRGRERLDDHRPRMNAVIDQQFAALSPTELDELRRLLGKLAGTCAEPSASATPITPSSTPRRRRKA
jgi:MarR family transcriptional regulator, lower aerobic nicotinate degradation pathway regulator